MARRLACPPENRGCGPTFRVHREHQGDNWRRERLPARLPLLALLALRAVLQQHPHIGDFTRWKEHDAYQKALDRLLRDLRVEKA